MTVLKYAFLFVFAAPAFSQTTIKGHSLGETAREFIAADSNLQSRLASCRSASPKPLTPEQIHSLSKADINFLSSQVFAEAERSTDDSYKWKKQPSRGDLEQMARNGKSITLDKRVPEEAHFCDSLIAASDQPGYSGSLQSPETAPQFTWYFEAGKLSRIEGSMERADFAQIETDLTTKIGAKPSENLVSDPAGFGRNRQAKWLTPELSAVLADTGKTVQLTVMSRAEYDASVKVPSKKSSPLD
ncbi:MAG TPA: hypothetical protein VL495_00475 [Edaphobacter sp.]|jgi:hypothetical protein|nr:hypothetical protein [Edaphobacter sp.]